MEPSPREEIMLGYCWQGWHSGALLDKCFFHLYQLWQCWHLGLDHAACTLGVGQVPLPGGKNPQARVSSEIPNIVLETLQTFKENSTVAISSERSLLVVLFSLLQPRAEKSSDGVETRLHPQDASSTPCPQL